MQNAMIPFGVDGGTRSSAADSIITYKTIRKRVRTKGPFYGTKLLDAPLFISPKRKKERPSLKRSRRCSSASSEAIQSTCTLHCAMNCNVLRGSMGVGEPLIKPAESSVVMIQRAEQREMLELGWPELLRLKGVEGGMGGEWRRRTRPVSLRWAQRPPAIKTVRIYFLHFGRILPFDGQLVQCSPSSMRKQRQSLYRSC